MDSKEYKYDAFISYRHVEPDREWAKWLHKALETYRVPKKLVRNRGTVPKIRRVFRDEDELPASASLSKEIESALQDSRYLIVVCSPRTPESQWVNEEIIRFRKMGRSDRILALLIEGEPSDAFPCALREIRKTEVETRGFVKQKFKNVEPLAADVRIRNDRSIRKVKEISKLRILAPLLKCSFDDLRQREYERRIRKLVGYGIVLSLLLSFVFCLAMIAIHQRNRAELALREVKQENYYNIIALAENKIELSLFNDAEELLWTVPKELRGWEWGRIMHLCHLDIVSLRPDGEELSSVILTPDAKHIITKSLSTIKVWDAKTLRGIETVKGYFNIPESVSISDDGKTLITKTGALKIWWDSKSGKKITAQHSHDDDVKSIIFSADGRWVITRHEDRTVRIWDSKTGDEIYSMKWNSNWIHALAFSPDGTKVILKSNGYTAKILDANSGNLLVSLKGHTGQVYSVAFSPDGKRAISGSMDGTARIWDVQTGIEMLTLYGHSKFVNYVAFSPDGEKIITRSDGIGIVWNARIGCRMSELKGPANWVKPEAFSPDGTKVITIKGSIAKIWNVEQGDEFLSLKGHTDLIYSAAYSHDGKRLITGSADGSAKIWNIEEGSELLTLSRHFSNAVYSVAFSHDDTRVVTGNRDGTVKIWDAGTGSEILTIKAHLEVYSAAFSPDDKRVVSGGWDTDAKIWDAESGRELLTLTHEQSDSVYSVTFSPDGKHIVTKSSRNRWSEEGYSLAHIWDANTGRKIISQRGSSIIFLESKAFSSDGKYVAMVDGNMVVIQATETGREIFRLKNNLGNIDSVSLSPDGKRLVMGSGGKAPTNPSSVPMNAIVTHWGPIGGTAKIWNVETGQLLLVLTEHGSKVGAVAFSPDGKRVATCSGNSTKIWDIEGRHLLTLISETYFMNPVNHVVFSPSGKRLATSFFNTVTIWDVRTGRETKLSRGLGPKYSADGKSYISISGNLIVTILDTANNRKIRSLEGQLPYYPSCEAFSPNGKRVAVGAGNLLKIWDAKTGREILTIKVRDIFVVIFSPDSRYVFTGGTSHGKLWDADTGTEILKLTYNSLQERTLSAAFSPNGQLIVIGHADTVDVWNTKNGRRFCTLRGHNGPVYTVAFSPDSKRVVTGSQDKTTKIWDIKTGREIMTLKGYSEFVGYVGFHGNQLITIETSDISTAPWRNYNPIIGYDNMQKIWDAFNWMISPQDIEHEKREAHRRLLNQD